jgi:hypothetical protein
MAKIVEVSVKAQLSELRDFVPYLAWRKKKSDPGKVAPCKY